MKIGIDINNVLRAYNEQVIKCYKKAFHKEVELNGISEKDADLAKILEFKSNKERKHFFFEDYVYEIFGCGTTMELMLLPHLNEWIKKMEDEGHRVYMISVGEHMLSMQSTMFFLSKIGVKCRYTFMPNELSELNDELDTLITANPELLNKKSNKLNIIGVKRGYNEKFINNADYVVYDLEDVFKLPMSRFKGKNKKANLITKLINKFVK